VEQTDWGQEMEITPLLTSVENGGCGDVFWKKYFLGLAAAAKEATQVWVAMELMVLIQRLRAGAWFGRTDCGPK
jgi:hypothetical protein